MSEKLQQKMQNSVDAFIDMISNRNSLKLLKLFSHNLGLDIEDITVQSPEYYGGFVKINLSENDGVILQFNKVKPNYEVVFIAGDTHQQEIASRNNVPFLLLDDRTIAIFRNAYHDLVKEAILRMEPNQAEKLALEKITTYSTSLEDVSVYNKHIHQTVATR